MTQATQSTSHCCIKRTRPPMLVALNDHPVSRRLKTPTSYRQATELSSQPQAIICRNKTF
ncbi:hypothetical protein D5J90_19095 [Salmonella enterica]|nr:hypothetical protein [Salmonella enterica]EBU8484934.1 hypothetical protein [Salmonella enterica subsp. enterica serovar Newport]EGW0478694.1 hypothetical protein [Salmonella enterica]